MPGWQTVDGERLRELRLEKMLSQAELAKIAGTTQVTISEIERGKRMAQPRTVRKLSDALGVEPRELIED
jgi:transcriptional regulator with XRE-family HTH domain